MGGAAAGEIASSMAAQHIYEHLTGNWSSDPENSASRFAIRMREAVEYANGQIHSYAGEHPEVRGMGTTLTAAGVYGTQLYLAQIGDSRAYLIRSGLAYQLTKDQSLTQRLVDAGELTEEEAETNVRRNIILQALGPDPRVKVVLSIQSLSRGDVLVVCSDGLSGLVRKTEIAEMVAMEPNLAEVCQQLIELANERGGPDNITVVTARFAGTGCRSPRTRKTSHVTRCCACLVPRRPPTTARRPSPPWRRAPWCRHHRRRRHQRRSRLLRRAIEPPSTESCSSSSPPRCGSSFTDPSPPGMKAVFTYLTGGRAGQAVVVEKTYALLGRAPQADVRFGPDHDLPVSGRHAAVVFRDGEWILRDLASTNGTFVNGVRITGEHQLGDQDLIRLGDGGPMLRFGRMPGEWSPPPGDPVAPAPRHWMCRFPSFPRRR